MVMQMVTTSSLSLWFLTTTRLSLLAADQCWLSLLQLTRQEMPEQLARSLLSLLLPLLSAC